MPRERPNLLVIHADQHRYDCTGPAGHPLVKTPALDRLAHEGVWFSHAYTSIPTCCPARQCLLSGKWAEAHGGLWNYDITLPVRLFDEPTWTEALAESGYRLGYVGKWHVHPTRTPLDFGFHDYVTAQDYRRWRQNEGHRDNDEDLGQALGLPPFQQRWIGGRDPVPLEATKTHWYAERALALIRGYEEAASPWHVRLDFEEPHLPCFPAEPFASMYESGEIPPWGSFGDTFQGKPYIQAQQLYNWGIQNWTWREWSAYVSRYLGMVSQIDDAVGGVLRALDEMGLADSTIVVYTTDHGDACGGHGMIDKHYVMYEDVVHVPLVVRWPGVATPGFKSDAFVVHTLDLASTLCRAAGLAVPDSYQGRSLLPLLRGNTPDDWRQDVMSTYNGAQFGLYVQRMLRDRRYKYVWNLTDTDELYDMREDPWEMQNLAGDADYADVVRDMRQRMLAQLDEHGDDIVRTAWMRRQLSEGIKLAR